MNNTALDHALEVAWAALRAHPKPNLVPFYQQQIYRAFGDTNQESVAYKRSILELLSLKKVLPLWERSLTEHSILSPILIATLIENTLAGLTNKSLVRETVDRYQRNMGG